MVSCAGHTFRLSEGPRVTETWGLTHTNSMHKQLMYKPEACWLIYTGEGCLSSISPAGWTDTDKFSPPIPLSHLANRPRCPFGRPGNDALGWAAALISCLPLVPKLELGAEGSSLTRCGFFLRSCPAPCLDLGLPTLPHQHLYEPTWSKWLPSPRSAGSHGSHCQWLALLQYSILTSTARSLTEAGRGGSTPGGRSHTQASDFVGRYVYPHRMTVSPQGMCPFLYSLCGNISQSHRTRTRPRTHGRGGVAALAHSLSVEAQLRFGDFSSGFSLNAGG